MEEQAQEIDQARREARTDGLTKVANRKAFDEKLHLVLDDWRREGAPFVLILADLDYFKRINDAHGHQAGDRALEMIGSRLKQWVREGDLVGRYGGDEFAVLLPQTELAAGMEIAETICLRTADKATRVACRGEQVSLSLSLGVAAPRRGDTAETLLQRADQALYRAKRLGRNQAQCQEPDEDQAASPPATDCVAAPVAGAAG
jgi:diguanylate cyclase